MDQHESHPAHPHPEGPHGTGYETRDANVRALLIAGAILIIFVVVVEVMSLLAYNGYFVARHEPLEIPKQPVNIYEQLAESRQSANKRLSSYGWVDRKAGTVHIPIERAFELVKKRGVPKGKGPMTEVEINSHHGTPVTPETKDKTPVPVKGEDTKK